MLQSPARSAMVRVLVPSKPRCANLCERGFENDLPSVDRTLLLTTFSLGRARLLVASFACERALDFQGSVFVVHGHGLSPKIDGKEGPGSRADAA